MISRDAQLTGDFLLTFISLTSMVGFHALQSRDKDSAAGQIVCLLLGGEGALDGAAGPEAVIHGTPGRLGIRAEQRGPILACDETRCRPAELEIHHAVGVDGRLDLVHIALVVEVDGQVVGTKGVHLLVKHEVGQRIRVPNVRLVPLQVEDLGVEMGRGMDSTIHSPTIPSATGPGMSRYPGSRPLSGLGPGDAGSGPGREQKGRVS